MATTSPQKTTWQLQDAKNKFSQVVDASAKKPQFITRHGSKTAVLMSYKAYQKMTDNKPGLKELLLNGPKVDLPDLTAYRKNTPMRGTPVDFDELDV